MSCDKCNEERARQSKYCIYCGADLTIPNGGLPCNSCATSRVRGFRFCNVCGRDVSSDPLPEDCPSCREYRNSGYRFCGTCGRPVGPDVPARRSSSIAPSFLLMTASVLLCTGLLLFEAFTGVYKIPYLMENLEGLTYTVFIIVPFMIDLFTVGDTAMRAIYLVELVIVLISISYLLYSAFKKFKGSGCRTDSLKHTGLYEVLCLNGLLLVFQMVYIMICTAMGLVDQTPISNNTAKDMFSLMNASVYEEFLCRFCLIGVPVAIVCKLFLKDDVPVHKYLLGGFEYKRWMIVLILFSAFIFGAGHVSGWGLWKIVPTFIFGLLTGYIFIKYGIYATISVHFLTDFLQSESWLFGLTSPVMSSSIMLIAGILALGCIPFYYRMIRDKIEGRSTKNS